MCADHFSCRLTLALIVCAALVGCGGIGTRYSTEYDPTDVRSAGPVAISVYGAPSAQYANAAAAAMASAMKTRHIQAASAPTSGEPAAFEAIVAVGAAAVRVDKLAGSDGDEMCKLLHHDKAIRAIRTDASSGHRMHALGLVCRGDRFMSMVWGRVPADGSRMNGELAKFVQYMFPVANMDEYTAHNSGS